MNYAFFPGCVAKGACPELYQSVMQVYPKLGIELDEMTTASCTGAGVLQEKDRKLGDVLNARTFALAEQQGLPIMTICSTCQGVMSQANHYVATRVSQGDQPHSPGGRLNLPGNDDDQTFSMDPVGRCGRGNASPAYHPSLDRLAGRAILRMLYSTPYRRAGI